VVAGSASIINLLKNESGEKSTGECAVMADLPIVGSRARKNGEDAIRCSVLAFKMKTCETGLDSCAAAGTIFSRPCSGS